MDGEKLFCSGCGKLFEEPNTDQPQESEKTCITCANSDNGSWLPLSTKCRVCVGNSYTKAAEWEPKPQEEELDKTHMPGERSEDWSDPNFVSFTWQCVFCKEWLSGNLFGATCPKNPGQKKHKKVFKFQEPEKTCETCRFVQDCVGTNCATRCKDSDRGYWRGKKL